jgi:hypothetical protein
MFTNFTTQAVYWLRRHQSSNTASERTCLRLEDIKLSQSI